MSGSELKEILLTIKNVVEKNKEIVTPKLLDIADKFADDWQKRPLWVPMVEGFLSNAGMSPEQISGLHESLKSFIEVERRLVVNGEGDGVIELLDKLANRPVILEMIARLVVR